MWDVFWAWKPFLEAGGVGKKKLRGEELPKRLAKKLGDVEARSESVDGVELELFGDGDVGVGDGDVSDDSGVVSDVERAAVDWAAANEFDLGRQEEKKRREERRRRELEEAERRWQDLEDRGISSRRTLADDVMWVYERLDDSRATEVESPSRGAWSLLKWARDKAHRTQFFSRLLPDAEREMSLRRQKAEEREEAAENVDELEMDRQERMSQEKLRAYLKAAIKESQRIIVDSNGRVRIPNLKNPLREES
jgi:hypothetical protein